MQRLDGRLIVSAHDLVGFLGCEHLTVLDLEVAEEKREKPDTTEDPQLTGRPVPMTATRGIGFPVFAGRFGPVLSSRRETLRAERIAGCGMMGEIIGEITVLETIALGHAIRDLARLQKLYGRGRWRKMKGRALMRLPSGRVRLVELHW